MLADSIFTTPSIDAVFSNESELHCLLQIESALAAAQEETGLIPSGAADMIAAVCAEPDWNPEFIRQETLKAGNPAIPFVTALKKRVAARHPEAVSFVHVGTTSQDLIDTALMLQLKAAFVLLSTDLGSLIDLLTGVKGEYGQAPMMARTLLQQALPFTFGDKVSGWLDGLTRTAERLRLTSQSQLAIQLGGPVGTLAQLGEQGIAIRQLMAQTLGLSDAPAWHTQRDRISDIGAVLGTLNGLLGKLATDVTLLMQTEVNELREGTEPGKGGSTSMPHKHNPVSATFMVAIAIQTPVLVSTLLSGMLQPHERAAGTWHSEWPVIRQLVRLTAANLRHANDLITGLVVDTNRMRQNMGS
jgi:3-carboxy-cis,cis-muconate cycloisomerase